MLQWCIQKTGSAGAVAMKPIVPPTQTWTAPCTPSRLEVNGAKVPFPITGGMVETIVVRSAVVPGERVTVIGESGEGIGTVGVKPTSQDGTSWSFSQFQYGMQTSGWTVISACSKMIRKMRCQGRKRSVPCW